ncbi:MAG: hypothetical protein ACYDH5_18175 [Acidimicrobiales bacterium]
MRLKLASASTGRISCAVQVGVPSRRRLGSWRAAWATASTPRLAIAHAHAAHAPQANALGQKPDGIGDWAARTKPARLGTVRGNGQPIATHSAAGNPATNTPTATSAPRPRSTTRARVTARRSR